MILSIIVPHKDSSALLERLLMSIPSNDEFEVIVVDDNSCLLYTSDAADD